MAASKGTEVILAVAAIGYAGAVAPWAWEPFNRSPLVRRRSHHPLLAIWANHPVLPLHEFRCLDGEFLQIGIQLLVALAPAGNKQLHRLTSLRVKAYRKMKVLHAGIDAGPSVGKLRCHDSYFKAAPWHGLYAAFATWSLLLPFVDDLLR